MSVEMHHMKRLTSIGGLLHRVAQRVERGRAQHGQVDLAAYRVQALQQRPGHHLVSHIPGPRAGDHHQHPQLAARHLQRAARRRPAGCGRSRPPPAPPDRCRHASAPTAAPAGQGRRTGTPPPGLCPGPQVEITWRASPKTDPNTRSPHPASFSPIVGPRSSQTPTAPTGNPPGTSAGPQGVGIEGHASGAREISSASPPSGQNKTLTWPSSSRSTTSRSGKSPPPAG